jgi:hypothetical protein
MNGTSSLTNKVALITGGKVWAKRFSKGEAIAGANAPLPPTQHT